MESGFWNYSNLWSGILLLYPIYLLPLFWNIILGRLCCGFLFSFFSFIEHCQGFMLCDCSAVCFFSRNLFYSCDFCVIYFCVVQCSYVIVAECIQVKAMDNLYGLPGSGAALLELPAKNLIFSTGCGQLSLLVKGFGSQAETRDCGGTARNKIIAVARTWQSSKKGKPIGKKL